ncbi:MULTISPECIES: helix-turn-helix domain-containing protein [Rhizobium]|uniref:helix-turn-helix domain-containing protein n=1 Tax=Rhizobium TaxID=379 RepID=UPI001030CFCD|nr:MULTISPECIES: helix-turn-helix transcriptional regulator [Rhizobium]TAX51862.1 transcriptional regulator [Rhizobium leguminosarum]TBB35996.1 transcriptional regulator [Rhizobium ruizarguesonis]TCB17948.1 transcriptional regulator [Rhizobium leguminosarum bv. viciae]
MGTVLHNWEPNVHNVDIFEISSLFKFFMDFSPGAFRAARALMGKTQEDVATSCGVDRRIIARLERLSYPKPTEAAHKVRRFYVNEGLEFLDANKTAGAGVRWKTGGQEDYFHRRQVNAARVLMDLSQTQLAKKLGVVRSVVTKYESGAVKTPDPGFIEHAVRVLEAEGAVFLPDTAVKGAGVRLVSATEAKPTTAS